jgi:hypothetical protein
MITNVTKPSVYGVDGIAHKVKIYEVDKDAKTVLCHIYSYPSQTVAGTSATPLMITKVKMNLSDIPTALKQALNDAKASLESEVVKLVDWTGGVVS